MNDDDCDYYAALLSAFRAQALLTQPTMKAVICYYKYPLNKIDLICKTQEGVISIEYLSEEMAPIGSYVYTDQWFQRIERPKRKSTLIQPWQPAGFKGVEDHKVPKEIRIRALVLT